MGTDYEALRARIYADFRERILHDDWGRYRVAGAANERYDEYVSTKQARRVVNRVRKESAEKTGRVEETRYDGNEGEGTYADSRIKTLDEAIAALGINEAEWEIYDATAKKWEVGAKIDVPTGETDANGDPITTQKLTAEPLYGFTFKMRRRVLEPQEFAPLKCISVGGNPLPVAAPSQKRFRRVLIVPDPQIGYKRDLRTGTLEPLHDRRGMDIVLQVAQRGGFDELVILGDWLDLAEWSNKYLRSPEFAMTTNPALSEGHWWLRQLGQAITGQRHFLLGNHEDRIRRAILKNLEAASGLKRGGEANAPSVLSLENLLALDDLGYEVHAPYPQGEVWFNDDAKALHGEVVRSKSGKTVAKVLQSAHTTEIFGHIHRVELASRLVHMRDRQLPIYAVSPGCLCRVDGAVPAAKSKLNWQQGFATLDYDVQGSAHTPHVYRIHDGACLYDGEFIEARNVNKV